MILIEFYTESDHHILEPFKSMEHNQDNYWLNGHSVTCRVYWRAVTALHETDCQPVLFRMINLTEA